MRRVRNILTEFTPEMVVALKASAATFKTYDLHNSSESKLNCHQGLSYYKKVEWEVGEDILAIRPEKKVFEVFVGLDCEYVEVSTRRELKGEDLIHGQMNKRHVPGPSLFHKLERKEQKLVEKENKMIGKGFRNKTLSYQLCIFSPELSVLENHVVFTNQEPTTFGEVMNVVSEVCNETPVMLSLKGVSVSGVVDSFVENVVLKVFLVSHFSVAELQGFEDFNSLKRSFDSVRGCFITMGSPYELSISIGDLSKDREKVTDLEIYLCDTTLLAPAGFKSLSALGSVIGLNKEEVSEFYKGRMDLLLKEHREVYLNYAVTDSIIALAYWVNIHVLTQRWIGPKLFQTVGSIAMSYFNNYLKKVKIRPKHFHGKDCSNFERYSYFAKSSYFGGRNESVCVGKIEETLRDVDLSGAYSIGMAHLPQLDHSKSYTTKELSEFENENVAGFAEVDFEFKEGTKFPCLPISSATGLFYPLKGRTSCTSYELGLAIRMGAKLTILEGLVIPGKAVDSPVLKDFVKDLRVERLKHKKGAAENNFYKLILNSLYGRFGLGVYPKKYFDSRSGSLREGTSDSNSNAYLAALTTGFIRSVLSELATELAVGGSLVVSMTTDGLITSCGLESIIKEIKTPLIMSFRRAIVSAGALDESYLELKTETEALYSWKTRGQFSIDHGRISALAGLQAPEGDLSVVSKWIAEEVFSEACVTKNSQGRLSSLQEVWSGSPFRKVNYVKYISTQYDFKRMLVLSPRSGSYLDSKPWNTLKEKDRFIKRYVKVYHKKVSTSKSLEEFEQFQLEVEAKSKAERARKQRLDTSLRNSWTIPEILKQCSRGALQGLLGFTRPYSPLSLIDHLRKHNIKEYLVNKKFCKIDSNFCKNQKRYSIKYNNLGLTNEVLQIIEIFQKLDRSFKAEELLYNKSALDIMRPESRKQLSLVLPFAASKLTWCEDYVKSI